MEIESLKEIPKPKNDEHVNVKWRLNKIPCTLHFSNTSMLNLHFYNPYLKSIKHTFDYQLIFQQYKILSEGKKGNKAEFFMRVCKQISEFKKDIFFD